MGRIIKSYLSCANLQVRKSSVHDYGVFAKEDIQSGAIIEECYLLFPNGKEESAYIDYEFSLKRGSRGLLLGYGSIYNHSNQPNAIYFFDQEHSLFKFIASRRIKRGEEIYISYGNEYFASRKIQPNEDPHSQQATKRWYLWQQWLSLMRLLMRFVLVVGIITFFTHIIAF